MLKNAWYYAEDNHFDIQKTLKSVIWTIFKLLAIINRRNADFVKSVAFFKQTYFLHYFLFDPNDDIQKN